MPSSRRHALTAALFAVSTGVGCCGGHSPVTRLNPSVA